mmetsp:Transcript_16345/g.40157  ORF Transcript_16345/g.40157 Transcript_16345/m.40157 type:complete len:201 (-) Transcript_16345:1117-1719(-)
MRHARPPGLRRAWHSPGTQISNLYVQTEVSPGVGQVRYCEHKSARTGTQLILGALKCSWTRLSHITPQPLVLCCPAIIAQSCTTILVTSEEHMAMTALSNAMSPSPFSLNASFLSGPSSNETPPPATLANKRPLSPQMPSNGSPPPPLSSNARHLFFVHDGILHFRENAGGLTEAGHLLLAQRNLHYLLHTVRPEHCRKR